MNVADAHLPVGDAEVTGEPQALAGKVKFRLARRLLEHLDVRPRDPAAPPRAQHLEHGLLRCESPGQVLVVTLGALRTVPLLVRRENAIEEVLPVLFDTPADPRRL